MAAEMRTKKILVILQSVHAGKVTQSGEGAMDTSLDSVSARPIVALVSCALVFAPIWVHFLRC